MGKIFMYISQWHLKVGSPGLSLFTFDTETAEMEKVRQISNDLSFGFSLVDQDRGLIYLCNECDVYPEVPFNSGRVYCYRIDPVSGGLTLVNRKETCCSFTSYLNLDPEKKHLIVSNHSMPNFSTRLTRDENGNIQPVLQHQDALMNLFALNEDGSIGEMLDFHNHGGIQTTLHGGLTIAHPHSAIRSPSGKIFACCDKGDGHMYLYSIEGDRLKLLSRTLTDVPGSEPRHCAFHPTMPYLFINHEHTPGDRLTVTTFRYGEDGSMEKVATFHGDVDGFEPKEAPRQQQGMAISPDGKTVYTQAHGHNLLLAMTVDEETGELRQIQATPIDGVWPRSLSFSPDGRFLICCALAGQISVYRRNPDGTLTDTGHRAFAKGAGCASFYRPSTPSKRGTITPPSGCASASSKPWA